MTGHAEQNWSSEIGEIDVVVLSDLLRVDPEIMIVDVRTVPEWEGARIPGIKRFILFEEFGRQYSEINVEKDTPIYLICRTGQRSDIAARYLARLGYTRAFNVLGGTVAWAKAGMPLESGPIPATGVQTSAE